jgi:hypothetical protein
MKRVLAIKLGIIEICVAMTLGIVLTMGWVMAAYSAEPDIILPKVEKNFRRLPAIPCPSRNYQARDLFKRIDMKNIPHLKINTKLPAYLDNHPDQSELVNIKRCTHELLVSIGDQTKSPNDLIQYSILSSTLFPDNGPAQAQKVPEPATLVVLVPAILFGLHCRRSRRKGFMGTPWR